LIIILKILFLYLLAIIYPLLLHGTSQAGIDHFMKISITQLILTVVRRGNCSCLSSVLRHMLCL